MQPQFMPLDRLPSQVSFPNQPGRQPVSSQPGSRPERIFLVPEIKKIHQSKQNIPVHYTTNPNNHKLPLGMHPPPNRPQQHLKEIMHSPLQPNHMRVPYQTRNPLQPSIIHAPHTNNIVQGNLVRKPSTGQPLKQDEVKRYQSNNLPGYNNFKNYIPDGIPIKAQVYPNPKQNTQLAIQQSINLPLGAPYANDSMSLPASMTNSLIIPRKDSNLILEKGSTFTPQVKESYFSQLSLRSNQSIETDSIKGKSRFNNSNPCNVNLSGSFQAAVTSDFGFNVSGFEDSQTVHSSNRSQEELYQNIDLKFSILAEKMRQVEEMVDQHHEDNRKHHEAIQRTRRDSDTPLTGGKVLKKCFSVLNTCADFNKHSFTSEKDAGPRAKKPIPTPLVIPKRLDFSQNQQNLPLPLNANSTSQLNTLDIASMLVSPNNSLPTTQRSFDDSHRDSYNSLFKKKSHCDNNESHPTSETMPNKKPVSQKQFCLDDFVKGKLLGKGKFGQVFVVKHRESGFLCAMKVVSKAVVREEKMENQIVRELKIAMFLSHPNVLSSYGFFDDQDNVYILMELCTGGNLYKLIQKHRRLSEQDTAYVVKQVSEGVRYLHSLQILHRDLKPENIVVENVITFYSKTLFVQGIAKICDFGWAVHAGNGMRNTVCGTPLYLSPEIVKGDQYDDRTDLWAIGILTYQLLIGRIPFRIWTEEQLNKIVSDEVTFPEYVEVSSQAKSFILSILEKDPNKRCFIENLADHPFLRGVDEIKQKLSI